jgi:phospholipid-binding lipoprotein MlaA
MTRKNNAWGRGLLLALIASTFIACSHNDSTIPVAAETQRPVTGTPGETRVPQDRTLDAELAAEYGEKTTSAPAPRPLSTDEQLDRELAAEYGNPPSARQKSSLDKELESEYDTPTTKGSLKEEYDTQSEQARLADPLKYWNVAWFHFNDKLYFWVVKPVAKGYGAAVPKSARECIGNFLTNLQFPSRFLNTFLQARPHHSAVETGRFIVNTTWGFLGFWDPATTKLHWRRYDEDFDQTLGTWKIGQGCYLVWPFFGPSSPRGTVGLAVDSALNVVPGGSVIRVINDVSLGQDSYEQLTKIAVDPYVAVRDAYVQNRRELVAKRH